MATSNVVTYLYAYVPGSIDLCLTCRFDAETLNHLPTLGQTSKGGHVGECQNPNHELILRIKRSYDDAKSGE
jgi:hypothetical protein